MNKNDSKHCATVFVEFHTNRPQLIIPYLLVAPSY